MKVSELATMVDGLLVGSEDPVIEGLLDTESAGPGQIAFLSGKIKPELVESCRASALLVPRDAPDLPLPVIKVDDPVWAATVIQNHFLAREFIPGGIHTSAVIGRDCTISREITIGPLVCLGDRVKVGRRVRVAAGCVIGDDVVIGDDCQLHPNVSLMARTVLGARVVLHSGAVIGSDGFGYASDRRGRHLKRQHVGYVQIDDDVEIGANACIDRGTFGRTWIKRGTKIDNLVQVAHNVQIGEDSIMVSQVGISGSTILGDGVILGGKVGVAGHLRIGNRVTAAAKAGITADLGNGEVVAGFPAIPHRKWLRAITSLTKLPELFKQVRELKQQIALLGGKAKDESD